MQAQVEARAESEAVDCHQQSSATDQLAVLSGPVHRQPSAAVHRRLDPEWVAGRPHTEGPDAGAAGVPLGYGLEGLQGPRTACTRRRSKIESLSSR